MENLEPLYVDFTLKGGKYRLREASEDAHIAYRTTMMRGVTLGSNGKPLNTPEGVVECNSVLISKCLFNLKEKDGSLIESPASLTFIRSLTNRQVEKMYKWVRSSSGMDDTETIEEVDLKIKVLQDQLVTMKNKDKKVDGKDSGPKELMPSIDNTSS